jgi:hypothetical protein
MLGRWEVHVAPAGKRATTLEELFDLLSPRVVRAIRAAHEAYARLGVRHALIGGLAVGVHGHPRATKDVEFLVAGEAFEASGSLVSFRAGIPVAAEGIPVDSILAPEAHAAVLDEALAAAVPFDGIPVITAEHLVLMKLIAGRRQDLADVEAMLRAERVDVAGTRRLLDRAAPATSAAFEQLVAEVGA